MPPSAALAPQKNPAGLRALLLKGGLAITDQALFAGANFLVSIVLARELEPAEYGAFSLANSGFLFLATLHQALLLEPMMIFGAGKYRDRLARYFPMVAILHAALLAPASLAMWGLAILLGHFFSPALRGTFEGVAASATFMLLFWLVRRIFYVLMKPAWSVLGGFLYLLFVAAGVTLLWRKQLLTPSTAFFAMGLAGLLSSALLAPRFLGMRDDSRLPLSWREVVSEHWSYGRWAMGSALMSWFPSNIYYLLLAAWLGLEGAGALRAVTNFVMPVLQAITAVNLLMIPSLVRALRSGGIAEMESSMTLFLKLYAAGCMLYLSVLWILRDRVFEIAYGGRYSDYMGWPLFLAAALPLGSSIYSVIGNGLRALERPDRMLWAFFGSSAAALIFGIPLTAKFGVSGALLGNHFSAIVFIAMLWRAFKAVSRTAAVSDSAHA